MLPHLLQALERKGYAIFVKGDLNLNIIAIRSSSRQAGVFDDHVAVVFQRNGRWETRQWEATTDPGVYWLQDPMNVAGTAIVVPGQYRGSHVRGTHKEKPALVQARPIAVWRDNNLDAVLDLGVAVDVGEFGINIHRAGTDSPEVHKWSAGCIVFKREEDFEEFLDLVDESASEYGDSFTLTLINEEDTWAST